MSEPIHSVGPDGTGAAGWKSPEALRSNNIDFLRFFLATSVIFSHAYAMPLGNDSAEPLYRFSGGQTTIGGLAVDMFFILSGFLITHSWLRSSSLWSFMWKRVLRIYPAFIVASILGVFVLAPLAAPDGWRSLRSVSIPEFLLRVVTLQNYRFDGAFPNNPFKNVVNGSLWSVSFEFWCYIGVAVLGLIGILKRWPALLAPMLIFSIIGAYVYGALGLKLGGGWVGSVVGAPRLWARLLPCYLAGMVFYLFRHRIPWHPALFMSAVALFIVACRVPHAAAAAAPVAGAYVLFSLAFTKGMRLRNFGRYGDFSYGIYVLAFPIQQVLTAKMGTDVPVWLHSLCAFGLILPGAILSWHLVEKPFLRLKRRKKPETAAVSAAA